MASPKFMFGASVAFVGAAVVAGLMLTWVWKFVLVAAGAGAIYAGLRIMAAAMREKHKEQDKQ